MELLSLGFDTRPAKEGAEELRREAEKIKSYYRQVDEARRSVMPVSQRAGFSAGGLADAARAAGQVEREVARASRGIESLRSSFGGAERAAVQFARGQRQLDEALRLGVVTQSEYGRLMRLNEANTTVAAVKARDLRTQLGGLNQTVALLGTSFGSFGPLAITAWTGISGAIAKARAEMAAFVTAQRLAAGGAVAGAAGGAAAVGLGTRALAAAGPPGIAAAIGTAAFAAITAGASSAAKEIEELDHRARALGISLQELRELRFAGQIADVHDVTGALETLTRNLGDLQNGTGRAKEGFEVLNLDFREMAKLAPIDVLHVIAERFKDLNDPAKEAIVLTRLFGESNRDMSRLLEGGSAGIQSLADEMRKLGTFTPEQITKADALGDAIERITNRWDTFTLQIRAKAIPAVVDWIQAIDGALERMGFATGDEPLAFTGGASGSFGPNTGVATGSWGPSVPEVGPFVKDPAKDAADAARAAAKASVEAASAQREWTDALFDTANAHAEGLAKNEASISAIERQNEATRQGRGAVEALNAELRIEQIVLEQMRNEPGPVSLEQLQRIRDAVTANQALTASMSEAEKAATQQRQAAESAARAAQEPWLEAARGVQRGMSDALFQAFRHGVSSAKDAAGLIKDVFARLAAELVAVNLFGGAFGQLGNAGTGGSALSLLGGGGGGGGLLGTLFNGIGGLFGGGGATESAAQVGTVLIDSESGAVITDAVASGTKTGLSGLVSKIGSIFSGGGSGGGFSLGGLFGGSGGSGGILGGVGSTGVGLGLVGGLLGQLIGLGGGGSAALGITSALYGPQLLNALGLGGGASLAAGLGGFVGGAGGLLGGLGATGLGGVLGSFGAGLAGTATVPATAAGSAALGAGSSIANFIPIVGQIAAIALAAYQSIGPSTQNLKGLESGNTLAGQSATKAALNAVLSTNIPSIGLAVTAGILASKDAPRFGLGFQTVAPGEGQDRATAGVFAESPFGDIALSSVHRVDPFSAGGTNAGRLGNRGTAFEFVNSIVALDKAIAASLNPEEIVKVTEQLRENVGQQDFLVSSRHRGKYIAVAIDQIFQGRISQIFEAIEAGVVGPVGVDADRLDVVGGAPLGHQRGGVHPAGLVDRVLLAVGGVGAAVLDVATGDALALEEHVGAVVVPGEAEVPLPRDRGEVGVELLATGELLRLPPDDVLAVDLADLAQPVGHRGLERLLVLSPRSRWSGSWPTRCRPMARSSGRSPSSTAGSCSAARPASTRMPRRFGGCPCSPRSCRTRWRPRGSSSPAGTAPARTASARRAAGASPRTRARPLRRTARATCPGDRRTASRSSCPRAAWSSGRRA